MRGKVCLLLCALSLISCSRDHTITVGSKNFTEQIVLGEIAAQQLERKLHIKVRRRFFLGGTMLTHEALKKGDIDLYPEYTGTAATAVLKQKVQNDPVQAYTQVKEAYRDKFRLIWLPPLGFNNTFAMVVREEDAARLHAPDLSSTGERSWRLGVGYEFLTRPDGLKRLDDAYQMKWEGTAQTMDLGLLYQALAQHKVDMAAGNSTDGLLADPQYHALQDDKHAFPPYNACFVVRNELIEQRPEIQMALTMLSGHIGDGIMRDLNRRIDVSHQAVERVVKEFLDTQQ